jgi:hypothetical protein
LAELKIPSKLKTKDGLSNKPFHSVLLVTAAKLVPLGSVSSSLSSKLLSKGRLSADTRLVVAAYRPHVLSREHRLAECQKEKDADQNRIQRPTASARRSRL